MKKMNFTLSPLNQPIVDCEGFFFANNLTEKFSGELVFTTSMSGYEQALTDLSYQGQVLLFTFPEIGTYDIQVDRLQALTCGPKITIAKKFIDPDGQLRKFFNQHGITAIEYPYTRELTKMVRKNGSLKIQMAHQENNNVFDKNNVCPIRPRNSIPFQVPNKEKLLVIDFGIKESILKELNQRKLDYDVIHWKEFIKVGRKHRNKLLSQLKGILLSNGPGNPEDYQEITPVILNYINLIPTFGICLGHQILALSLGAKIEKLHFGHHGNNHPVYSHKDEKVYITSQNHNYVVTKKDLPLNCQISFTHANDNSIAGLRYGPMSFSVQFHPEGCPGPTDTYKFFEDINQIIHQYSKDKSKWNFDTPNSRKTPGKISVAQSKTFSYWGQGRSLSVRALNSITPRSNALRY
ncbi:carbamoyl phosphate synthase small subunit [Bacteriovoracaceae bacterium]|nr:carbamoyl phosphate synthase small subunit [Bacteriovoracaceae bacterium]